MGEERNYYLAFSLVNGIGPKTFSLLLKYFKTAKNAWNATSSNLIDAGFRENIVLKIEKSKKQIDLGSYLLLLKHKKVSFVSLCDKEYPRLLKEISDPPIVLFVKGNLSEVNFDKTIGIVGTRKITNYGKEVTNKFAFDLASSGFTIVSGMALGVDAVGAFGAIEAGGKTVAVLGNGVDICVPSTNENLYNKILEGNGVIMSEFPLGFSPIKGSFPSRNRVIAGLSLGVLVTEGAKDSGSLITADYAFKLQRKVFAVPGPITSSLSVAPLKLIERGAVLVTSSQDISKIFNSQFPIFKNLSKMQILKKKTENLLGLTKEEQKILELLQNESLGFDEIVRMLGTESSKIGEILSLMEIKGLIKSSGLNYSITS